MPIETVVWNEYRTLQKEFDKLMAPLVECRMRPSRMDYLDRMKALACLESAYRDIYRFASDLLIESYKRTKETRSVRYLASQLPHRNPIKVEQGRFGDYIIKAPPLGDRPGGNAAFIAFLTETALKEAIKNGAEFSDFEDGCVIVKQYCHCNDVAMGTLENREVHSVTDTIIRKMKLDDNPTYFDYCYVWCESGTPRTEIIITHRKTARWYNQYVNDIYEEAPTRKRQYRINTTNHDSIRRNIHQISEALKTVGEVQAEGGNITQELALFVITFARRLSELICALRTPFISSSRHEWSSQYSKKMLRKKRMTQEEEIEDEIAFAEKMETMVDYKEGEITVYTTSPMGFRNEAGRSLCDDQQSLLMSKMLRRDDPISLGSNDDLILSVGRYISNEAGKYIADGDNINVDFVNRIKRRIKIIYSYAIRKEAPSIYDCIIKLELKNYETLILY